MRAKTLRTAAAVLVVLGLLAAAAPAVAAPARAEAGAGPALLQQLTAWLAGLWPGKGSVESEGPSASSQRLGPRLDPDGAPASDDDPTADPQLGIDADPDG